MVVERTAINQNYFFVNELSENSISFYKSRSLNISSNQSYKIDDIYPYVEWEVRPAAGSAYVSLSANPAGDIKTTLEALLGIADRDAYVTVTSVAGNATLVKLHLPATATNRSSNYIKSLFASNTGPEVRINNLSSTHRILVDNNITVSFMPGGTFSLAVLSGNSFEETSLPIGVVGGQIISELFSELTWRATGIESFDDFPIPFRCTATDLISGTSYLFKSGSLVNAMRASMSIPSLFAPEIIDSEDVDDPPCDSFTVDADVLDKLIAELGLDPSVALRNKLGKLLKPVLILFKNMVVLLLLF